MERARGQLAQASLFPPSRDERHSAVSGISRLWRSNQRSNSSAPSPNPAGKTFVVPLFLSTSRSSARNNLFARGALPIDTRSKTSTRSVIDDAVPDPTNVRPLAVPRLEQDEISDMYAGSLGARSTIEPISVVRNPGDRHVPSERQSSRSHHSGSRSVHSSRSGSRKHAGFSRASLRDPRVNSKAKISFTFGVTLLISLVIYLVLAVTGVAKNTMFHVVSILLILTLTGVFCHQFIRMLMIMRRPRRPQHRTAHRSRHRHAHERGHTHPRQQDTGKTRVELNDDLLAEKPIQIHMGSDTTTGFGPDVEMAGDQRTIQVPPPVYGNTRTSRRMNPDLVHWQEVPPTPLTPTYEDALNQVHHTVGYRPPSYLSSETGMSEMIESRTRDVDAALETIHPLERERMRNLAAEALEGRGHPGYF